MPIGSNKLDFIAFYNRFMPRVYRYVRYRVADTPTAEDLTSDVFEKALHSWDKLRNPDLMASWIFRIARNTVVSHYRRKGHLADVPLDSIQNKTSMAVDPEMYHWIVSRIRLPRLLTQRTERFMLSNGNASTTVYTGSLRVSNTLLLSSLGVG
jgi:RNA polymerase sigma factor (sigma-70 family)